MDGLFPPLLDGTLRAHYLMLFGAAGGIALAVGLVSAWIGARIGAKRAVREAWTETAAAHAALTADRLAELGRAVDAIALEVERISESQRYAARLASERQQLRAPSPLPPSAQHPAEQVTPH